ncbi:MBL fold metallo-hydrolase [soil metagenome]
MGQQLEFSDEQRWFVVTQPGAGIFAIREPLHAEDVRSYLVVGGKKAVLIDTGTGIGNIRKVVEGVTDLPVMVVNSHSHWDHIGGNWQFSDIAIHGLEAGWLDAADLNDTLQASCVPERLRGQLPPGVAWEDLEIRPSKATRLLQGGEQFDLGGRSIEAIHAPGHSPGLLVLIDREAGVLFSTDAVYPGPLYAQDDECDLEAYLATLEMLVDLAPSLTMVLPCHDGDEMPAEVIPAMRDAMAAVLAGRQPDEIDEVQAAHWFDGFGIYVPPGYRGRNAA